MHALQIMNSKILQALCDIEVGEYDNAKEKMREALQLCTIPNIVEFSNNMQLLFPERAQPKKPPANYINNLDKENYFIN